jgi:hypothetical protein
MKFFKKIFFIFIFLPCFVQATDSYDGTKLKIPYVRLGDNLYYDLAITVDKVLEVKGGEALVGYDTYYPSSNQLSIPSVTVGSQSYTNVVITVGKVLYITGQLPIGITLNNINVACLKIDCVDASVWLKNTSTILPSTAPKALNKLSNLTTSQKTLTDQANALFDQTTAVALLLIDNDQIAYEKYHSSIDPNSPMLGYSMTKSLVSLTVGKAICSGLFPDIDQKAKFINSKLDGLAYGEASIKQLLTMSSGALRGTRSKGGYPVQVSGFGDRYGHYDLVWNIWQQISGSGSFQTSDDGVQLKPGQEFSYKNFDTQSLGLLFPITGSNSLQNIFQEQLWKPFGTENNGYFNKDITGIVDAQASFHATAKDWTRFAIGVKDIARSSSTDCFTNYIKTATTKQIVNGGSLFKNSDEWIEHDFNGYGYQIWTNINFASQDIFFFLGYRGQIIAINPVKNRIMVLFQYLGEADNYKFINLFNKWN